MKSSLLAKLEDAMDLWIQENCEAEDWPNFYVHDTLLVEMAAAAAAVVDASERGQRYNEENR